MKIARSTRIRINLIKDEAAEVKRQLEQLHARLNEHSGTKRISDKLYRVIEQLDHWRLSA